ncbi:hypothetical protein FA15DRAFT_657645 [Coprinopsis marcescibilis]|uniref:Uncharacterized protein n=1 Tax=Coprinopsis marcescibilis TaxID=230819 RepID=A0A5C3KPQ5_COPMA|nr:hypothetical protein FA15DRAFT_657645 [Coprinopsis marcescibilis]
MYSTSLSNGSRNGKFSKGFPNKFAREASVAPSDAGYHADSDEHSESDMDKYSDFDGPALSQSNTTPTSSSSNGNPSKGPAKRFTREASEAPSDVGYQGDNDEHSKSDMYKDFDEPTLASQIAQALLDKHSNCAGSARCLCTT